MFDESTIRAAIQFEMDAALVPQNFTVAKVTVEDKIYRLSLNLQESDSLDENLEGYTAWWPGAPNPVTAEVLSVIAEQDELQLRYATGPPPPAPSAIKLYPPNFLEALLELWKSSRAPQFLAWAKQVKRQGPPRFAPLDPGRYPWLRRAQAAAFRLPSYETSFLWGPPGTGKTTTVAALLTSYLLDRPYSRILLIAANNVAVDQAVLAVDRALEQLSRKESAAATLRPLVKRIGTRFQPEAFQGREHLLERPEPELLERLRLLDTQRPARSHAAAYLRWKELRDGASSALRIPLAHTLQTARLFAMTAHRAIASYSTLLETGLFSLVCIDEASQIPLPYGLSLPSLGGATLFAGDPKQLAPIHQSPEPAVRDCFGQSPFALLDGEAERPYTVFLDEQSRMADSICRVVSRSFYGSRLRTSEKALNETNWRDFRRPVVLQPRGRQANTFLLRCDGASTYWPSYGGHVRIGTAKKVVEIVQRLAVKQAPDSILVLTPFRGQRNYVRKLLDEAQLAAVRVSTVHRAQGSEVASVLFDPVQTATRFLGENLELAQRLMNVAISRAQSGLFLFATNNDLQHPIVQALAPHFEIQVDLREHPDLDRITLDDLHAKNFPANVRYRDLLLPLGNHEWVPARILDATSSIRFLRLEDWCEETISLNGLAARVSARSDPYPVARD